MSTGNKYRKHIQVDQQGQVDVYDVLRAFEVTDPGLQHAIKKLLMPGMRGDKNFTEDLVESIDAIRATIASTKARSLGGTYERPSGSLPELAPALAAAPAMPPMGGKVPGKLLKDTLEDIV